MKDLKQCTILLVDDSKINIDILFKALVNDYELGVTIDGESTLEYVKNDPPDLILLDILMPGMDGFEVCQRLKGDPKTREIPVIFLTAMNEVESKTAGFAAGAVDYITKPFEISEVKARVKTHLRLRNALQAINEYNKQLEEMVEKRTKELIQTERQAAFSLMIQGIVHNLKNPLSGILGGSDIIVKSEKKLIDLIERLPKEDYESTVARIKKVSSCAKLIHTSGTQLLEMINSMMSKSRSDKSDKIVKINLNDIIKQEIDFLNADATFKNKINKQIDLSKEPLIIKVITSEISQIFQNLVKNSIDALWQTKNPFITIKTGQEKDMIWFYVEDNGPGIPEKNLSDIFDPFFTTKSKIVKTEKGPVGTGLGLHSCSEIIKTYSGKIDVKTEVGKGTRFTVYIPVIKA